MKKNNLAYKIYITDKHGQKRLYDKPVYREEDAYEIINKLPESSCTSYLLIGHDPVTKTDIPLGFGSLHELHTLKHKVSKDQRGRW